MSERTIVTIEDVVERRRLVDNIRSTVQCGLAERDERDITESIPALAEALFDPDQEVRTISLEAIHSAMHCSQAIGPALPALRRILEDETHDLHRAATALMADASREEYKLPDMEAALERLFDDPDGAVIRLAVRALSYQHLHHCDWTAFRKLLGDPRKAVRKWAIETAYPAPGSRLLDFKLAPLGPSLARHLDDPDPQTRLFAARALAKVDLENTLFFDLLPVLSQALDSKSVDSRKEAEYALKVALERFCESRKSSGSKRAKETLDQLADHLLVRLQNPATLPHCLDSLARVLLARKRFDDIARLIGQNPSKAGAILIAQLVDESWARKWGKRACKPASGRKWSDLDPLLPALRKASRRRALAGRYAATRALFKHHLHSALWQEAEAVFKHAPKAYKLKLLDVFTACRAKPCGKIDPLLPLLLDLIDDTDDKLAQAAAKTVENYAAPGAFGGPRRGDLSYAEQTRRARHVLGCLGQQLTTFGQRPWDLYSKMRNIEHSPAVAKQANRVERLSDDKKLEALLAALAQPNIVVKAWAARQIGTRALFDRHDVTKALPALASRFKSKDALLRHDVAMAVGQIASRNKVLGRACGPLIQVLRDDPVPEVRFRAAWAMDLAVCAGVELKKTAPSLIAGMADPNQRVVGNCVSGLIGGSSNAAQAQIILAALDQADLKTPDALRIRKRCLDRLKD